MGRLSQIVTAHGFLREEFGGTTEEQGSYSSSESLSEEAGDTGCSEPPGCRGTCRRV